MPEDPSPTIESARRAALRALAGAVGACCLPFATVARAQDGEPLVAAASDLQFALPEVASAFRASTGRGVRVVFGASGNLARQIAAGAQFELFLSADESLVTLLASQGGTADAGDIYAVGRLALYAPASSALDPSRGMAGLADALAAGAIRRFAIANPEHAPYGRAAREALESAALWGPIQGRLVLGENVAQAAQFAASGSAQGGIIAHSLAQAPQLQRNGRFALLPSSLHAPLRQRMVLLKGAGTTARAFHAWLRAPAARAILVRHGFDTPGD